LRFKIGVGLGGQSAPSGLLKLGWLRQVECIRSCICSPQSVQSGRIAEPVEKVQLGPDRTESTNVIPGSVPCWHEPGTAKTPQGSGTLPRASLIGRATKVTCTSGSAAGARNLHGRRNRAVEGEAARDNTTKSVEQFPTSGRQRWAFHVGRRGSRRENSSREENTVAHIEIGRSPIVVR